MKLKNDKIEKMIKEGPYTFDYQGEAFSVVQPKADKLPSQYATLNNKVTDPIPVK